MKCRLLCLAGLLALMVSGCANKPAAAPVSAPAAASRSDTSHTLLCSLRKTGDQYQGTCDVPCQVNALAVNFDGIKPGFSCAEPPRRVNASLRATQKNGVWLGEMQGRQIEDPTRFEVISTPAGGVAKLPFGWFALRSARVEAEMLALNIAVDKQLPPTADDVKIIQRAQNLLASPAVWNKNDDRNCPPKPQKYSLFCALMQATEEVSGGVHYRQPALQAVREVLNEVGGNRMGKHRLMDYNNHPDTTLQEVHQLLRTAQKRVEKDFR
jgi:hypothetical protein